MGKEDKNRDKEEIIIETKTKGFGFIKSCIGFLCLGPIGILFGFCGMGKSKTRIYKK
ncbi:hypothetical protein [Leptospira sp. B5-022]|uniref:hypothetical protein n=1 Tax=Leptospira sp. id769339 TaxID=2864221 RepID=UPI0002BE6A72|nr:hypothetical protein LEP1GSC192_1168 [Leptospira sp. B5-022]MCR1795458.1 hypothetical protein [Leptospira sp. id769339]